MGTTIVWFRNDLRLADNPALSAAVERGDAIVPVFVWTPEEEGFSRAGAASKWWLHHSLSAFDDSLRERGSRLLIQRGPVIAALHRLIKQTGADRVYWNRRYEPDLIALDRSVKEALRAVSITVDSFKAGLLHEPWEIANKSGKPYQVFTAFWKHYLAQPDPDPPLREPSVLRSPVRWPDSLRLEELELLPKIKWDSGLRAAWQPGESGATTAFEKFLSSAFENYSEGRNRPDLAGTSRMSPYLHFGEISVRQIWDRLRREGKEHRWPVQKWRNSQYVTEIGWREFAHHLLYHFPDTPVQPLRSEFQNFSWRNDPGLLRAWQKGLTGYPIVDAGMRELWATGWMHNRVRMIVASFLVKDLLIPWQEGAKWFWDTLVDADLANNTLGWQWTAGCGADAAPFFRIFNPTTQGEKFDPHGDYIRTWCPELALVPDMWIHAPHQAPAEVLRAVNVEIGRTYPEPIVNHAIAREVALEAFQRLKK